MNFNESHSKQRVLICDVCGLEMIQIHRGRNRQSCSVKCKSLHDKNLQIMKGNYYKEKSFVQCNSCYTKFETANARRRFCSESCRLTKTTATQSRVFFYKCGDCQMQFSTSRHLSGVSATKITRCKDCQLERRRMRNRKKTLVRQKAISNPKISVSLVAKRDSYLCHLCNQIVDMDIERTDKMGATIDHILPLSKGGLDTMENVGLAHWICNIKKGDRYDA